MADGAVVAGRVNFGEEVAVVRLPRGPRHRVVPGLDSVANPVVAHVDGFGSLEADGVVCDAFGGGVVGDHGGGVLGVAEVGEGVARGDGCLPVDEQARDLGLGCGGDHGGDDGADDVDGAVARGEDGVAVGGQELDAAGARSGVALR